MAVMDVRAEGQRQLERASRLLDVQSSGPQGAKKPVHKALEQLFGEARGRSQSDGAAFGGVSPWFGAAGASRLLQGPQAQRLDREVADFSISGSAGAAVGGSALGALGFAGLVKDEDEPSVGLAEFFALRHEKVLLGVVEEAHRDATRAMERHSADRIQSDWEEAKARILATMAPQRQRPGGAAGGAAGGGGGALAAVSRAAAAAQAGAGGGVAGTVVAPPQDAAIIRALEEPMSQSLAFRVGQLSAESCPAFGGELLECWSIVGHLLEPGAPAGARGALRYLQSRYAAEMKATVYRSADARLGGVPEAWCLVCAFGRVKFETSAFPCTPQHVWYAAYVAARAGFAHLLLELPDRSAPLSDRCEMLKTVCGLLARRLQSTAVAGQAADFASSAEVDRADLFRADLSEDAGPFHDVLVALLLGRSFAFGRLPDGTVEDWLWFRLHGLFMAGGDGGQGPEFEQHLEALQHQALSLPPSHYDPAPGALGAVPAVAMPGFDSFMSGAGFAGGVAAGITQTLNFVKVLLLTLQFGRAIQQLRSQDRSLRGPAAHIAVALHRSRALDALDGEEPAVSVAGLVCDYASQFRAADQLQYFRLLDPHDRAQALQRLLLQGGVGANDEMLGSIDGNGRHRPGLLEQALQVDGAADRAEFVDLCARAGRKALVQGQYREALRLLHLGRCHGDVLQVLCRCLRLPTWNDMSAASSAEATALGQDIQRFYAIYERNLDRYALSAQAWAVARKLYAARMFHSLCERGQPEAALDVFDREQLLPLAGGRAPTDEAGGHGLDAADPDAELVVEYPRLFANYVRILQYAAARSGGGVAVGTLQARVRQLQTFLAVHSHRLVLDQETTAALASLSLC